MSDVRVQVSIDLNAIEGATRRSLQHAKDVVRFARAGSKLVDATAYDDPGAFLSFDPAENLRLSLSEVKAATEIWLVTHVVRDLVDTTSAFLEQARACCAYFGLASKPTATWSDFQAVQEESAAFHRLGLPDKLKLLESHFEVVSDFQPHLLSLNRVRNCLVHRLGKVGERDLDSGGKLELTWIEISLQAVSPDGATVKPIAAEEVIDAGWALDLITGPQSRSFRLGEQVSITYEELMGVLLSTSSAISSYVRSVESFAKRRGIKFNAATAT